jgi:hypothetical protein
MQTMGNNLNPETISEVVEETVEDTVENTIEDLVEEKTEELVEEENLSPADKLAKLQIERMGNFNVTLSYDDASYLKNLLDKVEFKGPQQAYLLIISKLEMTQICETIKGLPKESRHSVEISAAAIESISFFINSKTGKGIDSAQRLFSASMQLRPAISHINRIEDEIDALKKENGIS